MDSEKGEGRIMKMGLVGAGRWGKNAARAMAAANVLEWVADADHGAGKSLASLHNVRHCVAELLDWDSVGALWICTPIPTHELLVHEALSRGKHVLCEKPLARTRAMAQDLAEDAARRGLVLCADHTWLAHHGVTSGLGGHQPYWAWRWARDDRPLDPIEDLLPHDVVLARRHFGCDVKRVEAYHGRHFDQWVDLDFGINDAFLSYSYAEDERRRMVMVGGFPADFKNDGTNLPGAPEPLTVILAEFLSAIAEKREPHIGGPAEFIHVAAVIEAAKKSRAAGGEWVDVE